MRNVLSPMDLVSRPDMDETVIITKQNLTSLHRQIILLSD